MKVLTPLKAIRKHCLDCCCHQQSEVRKCHIEDCFLFPYRMGHRPQTVEKHAKASAAKDSENN